jgi:hypothetical protein
METMNQQLLDLRGQLAQQLTEAEEESRKLQARITEWRGKIAAIDTLTGESQTEINPENQLEIDDSNEDGVFTPREAYWKPILRVLTETGGRSKRLKVIDAVGLKMKDILTPADYGKLPKSGWTRWRNRVAWQASEMRQQGYIKNHSPRGVWEITDAGRKWLDDNA